MHLKTVKAGVLEVAYEEYGQKEGPAVFLMHGFPYDVLSCREAAEILVAAGCHCFVPYLRGFGPTRFL